MRSLIRLALVAALAATGAEAQDADIGRSLFHTHCATCHGLEGRGDGPMAGVLIVKPVNLTELTAANAVVFPLERVVKRIACRKSSPVRGLQWAFVGALLWPPNLLPPKKGREK